jgi:hypothetical protein
MLLLSYDALIRNENNINQIEGAGAIYQRIVSLLALSKKLGIPFIHKKVNIGHNDTNMDFKLYDDLWNIFFNIKTIELSEEEKNSYKEINVYILTPDILKQILDNKNEKYIINIRNPYLITYNNPNEYYSIIQDEIIERYDMSNKDRPLIYNLDKFKNKINIAIHIRVYNELDMCGDNVDYLSNYCKGTTTRFYLDCNFYINLINKLKDKYKNSAIHIFSQAKYFDVKFKDLKSLDFLTFHLDMDNFNTFHHLCKADVLVLGLSSFSHLAGYYNKNEVIYLYYEYHSRAFDKWIDVSEIMNN